MGVRLNPSSPRKGKRGAASTAGEKTVGFSPKEWQLWGCRGDSEHPLLVFFGTVNGTFLLHKRKVGLELWVLETATL